MILPGSESETGDLNTLLYDFSGSSFHYNSDYKTAARVYNILGPASVDIANSFSPKVMESGDTSTMTIKIKPHS